MKRILFVDDDAMVLRSLQLVLRRYRERWDMVFVLGGEKGLDELRKGAFDVVVSDMRMPGMDGAEFLARVKSEYPATARLILSGQSSKESSLRAIRVANQLLEKPVDTDLLIDTLGRTAEPPLPVEDDALRRFMGSLETLPSAPAIYLELTAACEDPNAGMADIAAVIERDPATCARLLQLVNSAFFGVGQPIHSVPTAVTFLGTALVKALVLSANLFARPARSAQVGEFSFDELQREALLVARIAQMLPGEPAQVEVAATAGLLHDVGCLVLVDGAPDRFSDVLKHAAAEGRPVHELEREMLGVTHAEVGAYLLGLWGLPAGLVEAVAHHHAPEAIAGRPFGAAAAVYTAVGLFKGHALADGEKRSLDEAMLEGWGVASHLPRWRAWVSDAWRRASGG